jgi:hypothetical protein
MELAFCALWERISTRTDASNNAQVRFITSVFLWEKMDVFFSRGPRALCIAPRRLVVRSKQPGSDTSTDERRVLNAGEGVSIQVLDSRKISAVQWSGSRGEVDRKRRFAVVVVSGRVQLFIFPRGTDGMTAPRPPPLPNPHVFGLGLSSPIMILGLQMRCLSPPSRGPSQGR